MSKTSVVEEDNISLLPKLVNENFMAIKLNDEARGIEGIIQYDEAFGID